MNDDDNKNDKKARKEDDVYTGQKYNAGLYDDNENKDYYNQDDLNSSQAPLDEGLGDDASGDYDEDDDTLVAENDSDQTETGMDESDADNLEGKENLGDTVLDPEDSVE